jgi:hypothetical protein
VRFHTLFGTLLAKTVARQVALYCVCAAKFSAGSAALPKIAQSGGLAARPMLLRFDIWACREVLFN